MSASAAAVDATGTNDAASPSQQQQQRISAMRAVIDAKLHEDGVYEQIRELVRSKSTGSRPAAGFEQSEQDEERFLHDVLGSEVVQQLLSAVKTMKLNVAADKPVDECDPRTDTDAFEGDDSGGVRDAMAHPTNERDVCLFLRLAGGKAFVDQLLEEEEEEEEAAGREATWEDSLEPQIGRVKSFFRVVATFQSQRLSSKDVQCCVDPPFDEYFRFHVEKRKTRSSKLSRGGQSQHVPYEVEVVTPWEALCLVDEPVQLDLIKVSKKLVHWSHAGGPKWREVSRELLAVHRLDWRRVLCSTLQLVHLPVSLVGKMKVPIGSLDVRADLLHFKRTASVAREVSTFLNKETLQRNTLCHSFYQYAKQWWDEYRNDAAVYEAAQQTHEEHKVFSLVGSRARLVKLFAEDDDGKFRMVCKFVIPIRAPAAIKSPSEAARATLKITRQLLLASLLLGCGLDAYVCIGTVSADKSPSKSRAKRGHSAAPLGLEIGHVWVLTIGSSSSDVLFWESVTGERFALRDQSSRRLHGYCSIDCVFSHRQLFANLQPRTRALTDLSFRFEDESAWKAMSERMIADLPLAQPPLPLAAPDLAALPALEREWTLSLKRQISSRRRADGLTTRWSDELSFYLLPALNAYELERLYGLAQVDNALFQQSITRFVQEGHTFQGVPVVFSHTDAAHEALGALESNEIAAGIVGLHARAAQFGLAVRCFAYPEGVAVVW
ncbi:hypothetical protein PybrP1_005412 [[Pythium] brassicae (nom. inval.)]|nr:hypothetical protein PybrP1_005412 [[Pythium] brassicae (nom. inval.)]